MIEEDREREDLPKASMISEGPDKGLYDIPEGSCLCGFAQGPCYEHGTREVRKPTTYQLGLWNKLT